MTEKEREYREERQLKAIVDCNTLTIGCVTTATVARRLGMTASALYRLLNERHILFKSDGMWMLMPKYTKLGLLRYRYIPYCTMFAVAKQQVLMARLVLRACYQAQSHDSSTKARRAETSAEGF